MTMSIIVLAISDKKVIDCRSKHREYQECRFTSTSQIPSAKSNLPTTAPFCRMSTQVPEGGTH